MANSGQILLNSLIKNLNNTESLKVSLMQEGAANELFEQWSMPADLIKEYSIGTQKFVVIPRFINFVYKIPYTNNSKANPCEKENNYYHAAKQFNVQRLFLPNRLIAQTDKNKIYKQEKITFLEQTEYDAALSNLPSRFLRNPHVKDLAYSGFEKKWVYDVSHYYGVRAVLNLLDFVIEYELQDFHNENYGYMGKRPVIIDYSR